MPNLADPKRLGHATTFALITTALATMAVVTALALVVVGIAGPAPAASAQENAPSADGLVVIESTQSFDETYDSLVETLEGLEPVSVIAQVDHGAAASDAGLELSRNRVVFFGNPDLGTPVMAAARTAGIDLPQKMQVFEVDDRVFVAYNPASYVTSRHAIDSVDTAAQIDQALANIAASATGTDVPESLPTGSVAAGTGLTTTASANDFETTWNQLTNAIEGSPASIAFTLDHAENSGGTLPPTRLVVFGNPMIGTPMMQASPTAGVDLPLKMLVFEDADGVTQVVSTDPAYVAERHGVGSIDQIGAATNAIDNFTAAATSVAETGDDAADAGSDEAEGDETDSDSEDLARTGSEPILAIVGVTMILGGYLFVVAGRRS